MNAVLITPYFFPRIGGLENYALEIANGLITEHEWQLTVITSNHLGRGEIREKVGDITVIRLDTSFHISNTPVGINWYKKITEILTEIKPDIVNAHTPVPFISDVGIRVSKKLNIPTVLTYQNDIFKDNIFFKCINFLYYWLLGDKTLSLADKIVVTSDHYAKISHRLKHYQQKIVVIPPGIHPSKLLMTDANRENDYVLFVGQLDETHRHKGLDYLLKAIHLLKDLHPNIHLVVAGKGNDIDRYKKISKDLQIQEKVTFKGFVPDSQMSNLYANALCLCLPSISQSEGFGMVILEAAAQQTPSIGTKVGGIPSVIVDGITGLLVSPRNAKELSAAIKKLYMQTEVRNELGKNAYQRVMKEFLWEEQVKKTNVIFKNLI